MCSRGRVSPSPQTLSQLGIFPLKSKQNKTKQYNKEKGRATIWWRFLNKYLPTSARIILALLLHKVLRTKLTWVALRKKKMTIPLYVACSYVNASVKMARTFPRERSKTLLSCFPLVFPLPSGWLLCLIVSLLQQLCSKLENSHWWYEHTWVLLLIADFCRCISAASSIAHFPGRW